MAKLQPVGMTEDELEDAFVDWYFGDGYDIHSELEGKGYGHQFFGHDIPERSEFGSYALVTGEFPHGDLLYTKKMFDPRLWRELGLYPITPTTKRAAKAAYVMGAFADGETIELIDETRARGAIPREPRTHFKWAAVVHPCARPSCNWQGSIFDEFGPVTHVEAETKEDAVKLLFEDSDGWEPMRGAVDAVFTQMEEFRYPLHRNPGDLRLWRLDPRGWTAVRSVTPETADQWLSIWQRDEPGFTFVVSSKKPKKEKSFFEKHSRKRSGGLGGREQNPPFSGWREDWWLEKHPRDVTKIAYRRKRDALNVFMDWNQRLIDLAFNGPSQEHPADSFDNFNQKYDLKGKRKINTFAKAVWFALPAGTPYYLEDIDVDMLNETSPMRHNAEEGQLTIPDFAEERRLVDLEAAYWQDKYGDVFPEEEEELEEAPF